MLTLVLCAQFGDKTGFHHTHLPLEKYTKNQENGTQRVSCWITFEDVVHTSCW